MEKHVQKPLDNKYRESKFTYATFMETSEEEAESWYTFIRWEGNEEELQHLEKQLDSVDWLLDPGDNLSAFTLELGYLVSEATAKEMTKVDLNSQSFHRKFDGKMSRIELNLKDIKQERKKNRDNVNMDNIEKAMDKLSNGAIDQFLTDEDIDEEDLDGGSESEEEQKSSSEDEDEEELPVKHVPRSLRK
jgi:hypothetical protein